MACGFGIEVRFVVFEGYERFLVGGGVDSVT